MSEKEQKKATVYDLSQVSGASPSTISAQSQRHLAKAPHLEETAEKIMSR